MLYYILYQGKVWQLKMVMCILYALNQPVLVCFYTDNRLFSVAIMY